jgi:AIG2-like family
MGQRSATPSKRELRAILFVVFDIDPGEKGRLDRKEGLGKGYNEGNVFVTLDSGDEMKVLTYVADASALDATLPVYADYKAHVLDGAREHGLPASCIQSFIESVLAIAKPKQS